MKTFGFRSVEEMVKEIFKISDFMAEEGIDYDIVWDCGRCLIKNPNKNIIEPCCAFETVEVGRDYCAVNNFECYYQDMEMDVDSVQQLVNAIVEEFGEDYFNGAPIWDKDAEGYE